MVTFQKNEKYMLYVQQLTLNLMLLACVENLYLYDVNSLVVLLKRMRCVIIAVKQNKIVMRLNFYEL